MIIIGHRGARGLAPENTIAGLRKGLGHHADMLELDVRVTADGIPVLHHDSELSDPAGNKLVIADYKLTDLRHHKPDLPTLQEALDAANGKVPLMIEVKPGEPTAPIIKILERNPRDGVRLASFSQKTLLELHEALPEIPKVVIEKWSGVRAGRRMRQLGTRQACMNQRWLWWGFIRSVSRGGWELYAYTVNDPAKAHRWAKWGLTGIVTDFPDRFEK